MKAVLIIGLMIILGLLLVACAPQEVEDTDTLSSEPVALQPGEPAAPEPAAEPEIKTATVPSQPETPAETPEPEPEPEESQEVPDTGLTQEDLDELEELINDLESEDVGGLSE